MTTRCCHLMLSPPFHHLHTNASSILERWTPPQGTRQHILPLRTQPTTPPSQPRRKRMTSTRTPSLPDQAIYGHIRLCTETPTQLYIPPSIYLPADAPILIAPDRIHPRLPPLDQNKLKGTNLPTQVMPRPTRIELHYTPGVNCGTPQLPATATKATEADAEQYYQNFMVRCSKEASSSGLTEEEKAKTLMYRGYRWKSPCKVYHFSDTSTVFLHYERNEIDFDALSRKYFIHTTLFNLDLYKDAWQSVTETWYTPPVWDWCKDIPPWRPGLPMPWDSPVPHEAPEEPGSEPVDAEPISVAPSTAIAPTSAPQVVTMDVLDQFKSDIDAKFDKLYALIASALPHKDNLLKPLTALKDPNVANIDDDFKDSLSCSLYAANIYDNMRVLARRPYPNFMETVQRDITHSMRAILVDWLVELYILKEVHGKVVTLGMWGNVVVESSLLDMCGKCMDVGCASAVFVRMSPREKERGVRECEVCADAGVRSPIYRHASQDINTIVLASIWVPHSGFPGRIEKLTHEYDRIEMNTACIHVLVLQIARIGQNELNTARIEINMGRIDDEGVDSSVQVPSDCFLDGCLVFWLTNEYYSLPLQALELIFTSPLQALEKTGDNGRRKELNRRSGDPEEGYGNEPASMRISRLAAWQNNPAAQQNDHIAGSCAPSAH
ncbi:hypothetical protein Fmac_024800 [Flemingia macrophylla]|uniref:Cyclin N-terminal domain-containing protein n=1 Tax=Flemingia macrophylla TaxID=520843 RepID=A0ABD1LQE3_9FABA